MIGVIASTSWAPLAVRVRRRQVVVLFIVGQGGTDTADGSGALQNVSMRAATAAELKWRPNRPERILGASNPEGPSKETLPV